MSTELALLHAGRISEADLERARARRTGPRASADLIDLLVEIGAITQKELERQLRLHIESVVFELMSWSEGFFSFEERARGDMPTDSRITRVDRIAAHGGRAAHRRMVAHRRHRSQPRRHSGIGAGERGSRWRRRRRLDARSAAARVAGADDDRRRARPARRSPRRWRATNSRLRRSRTASRRRASSALRAPSRTTQEFDGDRRRVASRGGAHAHAGRASRRRGRRAAPRLQEDPLTPGIHLDFAFAAARTGDSPRRAPAGSTSSVSRRSDRGRGARARCDRGARPADRSSSRRRPMADDIRRWSDELARDPSSLVFLQLGEALRRQGQLDVALKIALRGLERHPRTSKRTISSRASPSTAAISRVRSRMGSGAPPRPESPRRDEGAGLRVLSVRPVRRRRAVSRSGGGARWRVGRDVGAADGSALAAVSSPRQPEPSRPAIRSGCSPTCWSTTGRRRFCSTGTATCWAASMSTTRATTSGVEIGAQLSGISDEVVRATRHLDIGDWRSIAFETQVAVVAMAPAPDAALLVVAASRTTPLGLLRRLARPMRRASARVAGR